MEKSTDQLIRDLPLFTSRPRAEAALGADFFGSSAAFQNPSVFDPKVFLTPSQQTLQVLQQYKPLLYSAAAVLGVFGLVMLARRKRR